jgi:hypothetical protein
VSLVTYTKVLCYTKVLGVGLEERVLLCLGSLADAKGSSSRFLTGLVMRVDATAR